MTFIDCPLMTIPHSTAEPLLGNFVGGWEVVLLVFLFGVPIAGVAILIATRGDIQVPAGAAPAASVGLRYLAKIVDLIVVLVPGFLIGSADEMAGGLAILFGWLLYNWLAVAFWGSTLGK